MLAVLFVAQGAVRAQQTAATKPAGQQPTFEESVPRGPLRHAGNYPSFNVQWQVDSRVSGVQAVFPHPAFPSRIVLVTESGLSISNDTGKTWKQIADSSPEKIGVIRHVEFAPDDIDTMYLASATKGIWRLDTDKAPVQIGSTANGLADDSTAQVRFDGGDLRLQTLLAVHGNAAAGLSKSVDGGQTWSVVPGTKAYFINKLVCGGPGMSWAFFCANQKGAASPQCIYSCPAIGDFLHEVARDTQATDAAAEMIASGRQKDRREVSYWATAGFGLLVAVHGGIDSERIGPDAVRWSSVGLTWGPTADSRIIYAYEPSKLGMAVSQDEGKTFTAFSRGLQTGPFIKQGAAVRANANGSVFLAVVNDALYVARRYTGVLAITDVKVDPPLCVFSQSAYEEGMRNFRSRLSDFKGQRSAAAASGALVEQVNALKPAMPNTTFTITARISGADAPASATVDLSRVSVMPAKDCRTPLYDDGKHGDGADGDGIYGGSFSIRPERLINDWRDWRRPWPGPMALTVTAVTKDGSLSSAIGVLTIINRPETFTMFTPRAAKDWPGAEGQVTAELNDSAPPAAGRRQIRKGLRITAKEAPWRLPLPTNQVKDVLGYYAISFYVQGDISSASDLGVQFRDDVPDSLPRAGSKVLIAKDGFIEAGKDADGWRRVVIPIERLVAEPPDSSSDERLRPTMVGSILLSGPGSQTVNISDIKCCVSAKEVEAGAAGGKE